MTFDPSIANGQTVMDVLQLQATLAGYSLVDSDGVTIEPGSGLAVDVTFSTEARLGGPAESVADVAGHSLPSADPDDPRKVLLYLDANGDVQSIAGDAASASPTGKERTRAGVPDVPLPSEPFCPLAEIWLAAGASTIVQNDISSRRVPFVQGDMFRGSSNVVDPLLWFGLYPTNLDASTREEIYNEKFETVADSYEVMNTIVQYSSIVDEVAVSSTAMEAVASSTIAMDIMIDSDDIAWPTILEEQISMDEISTSVTAMNVISDTEKAMDTIRDSNIAWNTIAEASMAIGKFVAGRAGLDGSNYADIDAIVTSQTAMDTVSASQSAMDAVSASQIAMDAVLTSEFVLDTVWSNNMPSTKVWESGDPAPPTNDISFIDGPTASGTAIAFSVDQPDGGDQEFWEIDTDLTDISTLNVQQQNNGQSNERINHEIHVDGDTLFSTSEEFNWAERNLDVSSYSGTVTVSLGWVCPIGTAGSTQTAYGDLILE